MVKQNVGLMGFLFLSMIPVIVSIHFYYSNETSSKSNS